MEDEFKELYKLKSEIRTQFHEMKQLQKEKEKEEQRLEKEKLMNKLKKKKRTMALFDLWYSKVVPKQKDNYMNLKSFEKAMVLINRANRGTLFDTISSDIDIDKLRNRKISIEEIKVCIEKHIKALSDDYEPAEKKWLIMHLNDFMYNPYNPSFKSSLAYWMFNEPKEIIRLKNTDLSGVLDEILKQMGWIEIKNEKKNLIVEFLNKNKSFIQSIKINYVYSMKSKDEMIVKILIDCLYMNFKGINNFIVTPGIFANPKCLSWIKSVIGNCKYTQ